MKHFVHRAYHPNYNFPIHISTPDSVRDHLDDKVRLLSVMPEEWPKLRCRDLDRDNLTVESTYEFEMDGKTHLVEVVALKHPDTRGKLVDGKYFFTFASLAAGMDLELLFANFKSNKIRPRVQHDWSLEYPSNNIACYSLVAADDPHTDTPDPYFDFIGLDKLGIECLADLLAQAYKFTWSWQDVGFAAIADAKAIVQRLRKPWMQFLTQRFIGEQSTVEADHGKVIAFLVGKLGSKLSPDEKELLAPWIDSPSADSLTGAAARQRVMNCLVTAYTASTPLNVGSDVDSDPLFCFSEKDLAGEK